MTIGKSIQKARTNRGISRMTLSRKTGVAYQTLMNWEREASFPNIMTLIDVANALDVSLDELVGRNWTCPNLKDVIGNTKYLFAMHPTPWQIESDSLDGYVVDADGKRIFGGEYGEGYVSKNDKNIVALVDVVNSLWVYMRRADDEN